MIVAKAEKKLAKEVLSFVSPRANIQGVDKDYAHIGYYENDKIVGGVIFSHYDGHNIWMHMALDNPKAMRRSFAKQVFDYCFYTCKCVRVTAMTRPNNSRCRRLIESAGFKQEGFIRKVIKEGMVYHNAVLYGLLRNECKYL
jgi:RimJ/RimL family protein N-acetyltransferase